MNNLKKVFLSILFFLFWNLVSFSQCVMCSSTIETSKQEGGLTGAGINSGVGYLSFFPYLILSFFAFIFYKAYKKDKEQQENQ